MNEIQSQPFSDSFKLQGKPFQVISSEQGSGEGIMEINEDLLQNILCDPSVSHKKVIVVCIIGPMRQGKSFLMNYVLRYLASKQNINALCNLDNPLEGFGWKFGMGIVTQGTFMWNELFSMTIDREVVKVVLLDTKGIFSKTSSYRQSVQICSLAMLLSSFIIVNVPHNLEQNVIDFIALCTNYSTMILDSWSYQKPFQNLMFVVRDWHLSPNFPFGIEGGNNYLKFHSKTLKQNLLEEALITRYYRSTYATIECCLMPHPGQKAATNPNFDGRIRDIQTEFVEILKQLVVHIVSPNNFHPKIINNNNVTCQDLFSYFKSFYKIMNENNLPKVYFGIQENVKVRKWEIIETMINSYISQMDKFLLSNRTFCSNDKLRAEHQNIEKNIIEKISHSNMFLKKYTVEEVRLETVANLSIIFNRYYIDNSYKNLQLGMFTPFAFLTLVMALYFLLCFFQLLHIKIIITMAQFCLSISVATIIIWMGTSLWEIEELSGILDEMADILLLHVYNPMIMMCINKPAKVMQVFFQSVSERKIQS